MQPYRFERSFDHASNVINSAHHPDASQKLEVETQKKLQEIFQKGFEEGFEKGLKKQTNDRDERVAQTLSKLQMEIKLLVDKTADFHRGVLQTSVPMVIETLSSLFPSLKKDMTLLVQDLTNAVLPLIENLDSQDIEVYVHSSLTDFLSIHLSTLGSPVNFKLKVDNSLQPGDCRARFGQGALEHIKERILSEVLRLLQRMVIPVNDSQQKRRKET